jgi:argininosuccinate lyase
VNAAASSAAARAHRLWGGRFQGDSAPEFTALNNSIGVDFRLWPFDIRASKAWAVALWGAGVLTLEESHTIERGLDAVAARLTSGEKPGPSDEDVHTLIDRLLHEEIGGVASKLHTGRSRNDQVATSSRLWCIEAASRVGEQVRGLQQLLADRAADLDTAVMPGYTHMQRAIPVSAAHWLLSHFWPLERDRQRLRAAQRSAAVLPLGSGALAGCAYPISRTLLQGTLGFDAVSQNSIDAVSDRDYVIELVFACAMVGTHLSRLAEDLIIYGSSEFGFVQFGETFTSGSSMMPQKRNPDALEIARGSAARLLGDHVSLLATVKGLPSSYNKDLQDDKRALFDAVDTLLLVLPGVAGAIAESSFQRAAMSNAVSSTMLATDLADYLVRKGATFRDAHGAVGQLIRLSETEKRDLADLPRSAFVTANALFTDDVSDALDVHRSLERRSVSGGTAPTAVRAQLDAARAALKD